MNYRSIKHQITGAAAYSRKFVGTVTAYSVRCLRHLNDLRSSEMLGISLWLVTMVRIRHDQ